MYVQGRSVEIHLACPDEHLLVDRFHAPQPSDFDSGWELAVCCILSCKPLHALTAVKIFWLHQGSFWSIKTKASTNVRSQQEFAEFANL